MRESEERTTRRRTTPIPAPCGEEFWEIGEFHAERVRAWPHGPYLDRDGRLRQWPGGPYPYPDGTLRQRPDEPYVGPDGERRQGEDRAYIDPDWNGGPYEELYRRDWTIDPFAGRVHHKLFCRLARCCPRIQAPAPECLEAVLRRCELMCKDRECELPLSRESVLEHCPVARRDGTGRWLRDRCPFL